MILFSKLLSQCILGLTLLTYPMPVDAASASGGSIQASPSAAVAPVVTVECPRPQTGGGDQIEGLAVGDRLNLNQKGGAPGSGGTLEVVAVDANGKVTWFLITTWDSDGDPVHTEYVWFNGCYYPPWMTWHRYCFKKSSPGIYKYEKFNTNNDLMEKGSAMDPSQQPPPR